MSYAIYRQLSAPTGIDHAVKAAFIDSNETNLIVAKANLIEVYSVARVKQPDGGTRARLHLRLSRMLFGNVAALGAVRLPGAKRDALVVAFRDAKAVVVEYDPSRHELRNVSLHLYEDDRDAVEEGYTRYVRAPILRVDLAQRCAVMLCLDRKLVVLPFISASNDAAGGLSDDGTDRGSSRLPSYVLNLKEMGIINVKDIAFLHGYYDPTLVLLYEPKRTWAGRLALHRDTCQLTALTLDIIGRRQPTIWSAERLPYDSYAVHPLTEAAGGGVLVLSPNVILHLSQSSRLGLALNSFAVPVEGEPVPYPLEESPVVLALDAATSLSLAHNRVLLSLRGGELYVLHIRTGELGRAIAGLELSKAGNSVPASSICQLTSDLVFLASRQGDSLLLHFSDTRQSATAADAQPSSSNGAEVKAEVNLEDDLYGNSVAPAEKKLRREGETVLTLEGVHVTASRTFGTEEDNEAAALFGTADLSAPIGQAAVYDFTVEDALPNVGPIGDFAVGESRDAASMSVGVVPKEDKKEEEGAAPANPFRQAELVTCSGAAKSGSLRIMQHGLRPHVYDQYPGISGCLAMWALYGSNSDGKHAYQVLSRTDGTQLLADLQEVEGSVDFVLTGPTIDAGNVYGRDRMVQVYAGGVRLLDGTQSVQEVTPTGDVVLSSILDPYIVIVLASGMLLLLTASSAAKDTLIETEPSLPINRGQITAVSLFTAFTDSGPFASASAVGAGLQDVKVKKEEESKRDAELLEDAEAIYGVGGLDAVPTKRGREEAEAPSSAENDARRIEAHFCAICRDTGALEIYTVPNFALVFQTSLFCRAPQLVLHSPDTAASRSAPAVADANPVVELRLSTLGTTRGWPFVAAVLKSGDLLLYTSFAHVPTGAAAVAASSPLAPMLRFARIQHTFITRRLQSAPALSSTPSQRLIPFGNIGGKSGIFVAGARPLWFFAERDAPLLVPMQCDGEVTCLTPLNMDSLPNGFIYVTAKATLKICVLKEHVDFSATAWGTHKVAVKPRLLAKEGVTLVPSCTVHKLAYDPDSNTYAVLISQLAHIAPQPIVPRPERDPKEPEPMPIKLEESAEPKKEAKLGDTEVLPPRAMPFLDHMFELQLISASTWEMLDRIQLEEYEHGMALRVLQLGLEANQQKKNAYLVLSTGYLQGEDVSAKGRIFVFEIVKLGQLDLMGAAKLSLLTTKEQKAAVSAVGAVQDGFLVTALGPKIVTISMSTVKNFIVLADMYKSIYFLRWRHAGRQLTLLAKDYQHSQALAAEVLIDPPGMSIVLADANKNVTLFSYSPLDVESRGGQMLICKSEFHVGMQVSRMLRVRLQALGGKNLRYGDLLSGLDGRVGLIAPVDELMFRRLMTLQTKLITALPHTMALNPKAYRQFKSKNTLPRTNTKHMLDGDLLWKFVSLDSAQQKELAKAIGSSVETILDNLLQLDLMSTLF